jgi:hypothetical protein
MGLARSMARKRTTSSWTSNQTPSITRAAAAIAAMAIAASAFLKNDAIRRTLHVPFAMSTRASDRALPILETSIPSARDVDVSCERMNVFRRRHEYLSAER